MVYIRRRIIKCQVCDQSYGQIDKRDRGVCPNCRLERKGTKESLYGVSGARIVNDPLEPGGFKPGAYFSKMEVVVMVKANSFTDGTVVKSRGMVFTYSSQLQDFIKTITKAGNRTESEQSRPGRPRKELQPAGG